MFIHFCLVYAHHVLNTIVFLVLLAPPLAQCPRQPPGSPNGSTGTGCNKFAEILSLHLFLSFQILLT